MTTQSLAELDAADAVSRWLRDFEAALGRQDAAAATALFTPDGHWRDLVSFSWGIRTVSGAAAIEKALAKALPRTRPSGFRIAEKRTEPRVVKRAGVETIEAIIAFETAAGRCSGIVRLVPAQDGASGLRCWVLLTTQDEIKGHEERIGKRRPRGEEWSGGFGGENWMDHRLKTVAYADREPAVVVIGGSQSGLGIAACLNILGVDTLVIDRHERVGDAWRKRYHNLTLHNEVFVDHMPYMPFPPNYPVYIPRDKIANWLEFYADTMEINIWSSTEFTGGTYDAKEDRYALTVRRADGTERILRPRHVVFATGVSAIPIMPDLPGIEAFAGELLHSSKYDSGHKWKGKKGIVIGTGNSGHDVAHDLCVAGVDTTMVQRSTTLIVSLKEAQRVYDLYQEGSSTEDCDLIATASPYPVLVQGYKLTAAACQAADKPLLEGLAARGFQLDNGEPDNTGFQMKYLRRGGGYYFNVGCSDLIVEGKIKLLQHRDIERVVPQGLKMKDGTVAEADVIVAATGYKNQQDVVRHFFGDAMADRIGEVWGFDEGGELRNMWCRTPQPGLWFVGGGLPHVRIYSKFLAQQIKACEEGLLDRQLDGQVAPPMRIPRMAAE
ncbi:MAG: NAD(P)/FAD-dependent oxidoreductase [Hyphomicrobiaceae bacterium]|nr:NAD(P)/FAD-dependent oxidoreductase [Hyphomicrobiaceae bacterium]